MRIHFSSKSSLCYLLSLIKNPYIQGFQKRRLFENNEFQTLSKQVSFLEALPFREIGFKLIILKSKIFFIHNQIERARKKTVNERSHCIVYNFNVN